MHLAVAQATEVDAMMEMENKKTAKTRGEVRVVRSAEEDPLHEVRKQKGELTDNHSSVA